MFFYFQLNITWKTETEVFEYPSFDSSKDDETDDSRSGSGGARSGSGGSRGVQASSRNSQTAPKQSLKTNTSVGSNSKGEQSWISLLNQRFILTKIKN